MNMIKEINSKYRWIVAILILILPVCTMLPYLAMSVLMNDIMVELNIGYSLAGLTMTIMLAICGLCMFVGNAIQDKIGVRKTMIIAVWMMSLGSAVCFIANNFIILIFGRILSGIGFGLSIVSLSPYMSTWFKGKQRAFMITASLISNNVFAVVSYSVANPLKGVAGTWRGVFGVYSIMIAGIAVLWMVFGHSNVELEKSSKQRIQNKGIKQESSLVKAFKIKQYRLLMISGIFMTCASTAITAFLPSYLTNEKGLTMEFAVIAANVKSVGYIVGSLVGGGIMAKTGRRKPIVQTGLIFMMIGGLLFSVVDTQVLVMATVILIALGHMSLMPAQSTITMETMQPFDPAILGGATAMVNGIGQMASLTVSPVFSKISEGIGMSGAMQVFFGLLAISIVISFFIRETGPKTEDIAVYVQGSDVMSSG